MSLYPHLAGEGPEKGALPLDGPGLLDPLAADRSREDFQGHIAFNLQSPWENHVSLSLQFQSLEKCWNVSGGRYIVDRTNEGVNEPSQGDGDLRDVERLNDPAHSTFVTDPDP